MGVNRMENQEDKKDILKKEPQSQQQPETQPQQSQQPSRQTQTQQQNQQPPPQSQYQQQSQQQYQYQPNMQQQPYQPQQPQYYTPEAYPHMTLKDWIVTMLLMLIPIANIILPFMWAFGTNVNPSKKTYFQAMLIMALAGIVFWIVIMVLFGAAFYSLRTTNSFSY